MAGNARDFVDRSSRPMFSAAGKISRLAMASRPRPTLRRYRTPEDTSQDYHIEGLPFGTAAACS